MSGRTACSRRLWRRLSRIAVSSCHGRPCHVEPRGGPTWPPVCSSEGGYAPLGLPRPPSSRPGEAMTRLDELLAQLDLAAHRHGALGGDRPALAATLGRAAAQLERRGVEERRARLRRVG